MHRNNNENSENDVSKNGHESAVVFLVVRIQEDIRGERLRGEAEEYIDEFRGAVLQFLALCHVSTDWSAPVFNEKRHNACEQSGQIKTKHHPLSV